MRTRTHAHTPLISDGSRSLIVWNTVKHPKELHKNTLIPKFIFLFLYFSSFQALFLLLLALPAAFNLLILFTRVIYNNITSYQTKVNIIHDYWITSLWFIPLNNPMKIHYKDRHANTITRPTDTEGIVTKSVLIPDRFCLCLVVFPKAYLIGVYMGKIAAGN